MKNFYKLLGIFICCFLCTAGQQLFAQPPNDECSGAIDISEAFMGSCGDFTFNGPFDLTGSSPGVDDPPEPGEMGVCPDEEDANLFGDDSETWENSVWYTWTVPDLNGDGSDVAYSIWTSDGSYNDDCGLNPNNIIGGDADTQVAIYKMDDCPNSATGECDHLAANEDLFSVPPWISGWLTLEFTPGETYYMGVDGWDGVQGEFCLTVVICGVECGDGNCAPVETYCQCEDCREECPYSTFSGIDVREDGNFRSPDFEGNIFVCSESVVGFDNGNVYLGLIANETATCDGTVINLPLEFSVGSLIGSDEDGLDTLSQGFFSYLELTPDDIAAGSITITSIQNDGLGNDCSSSVTLNFADFPQATEPYCNLPCFAGGVDTQFLENGITVCEGTPFTLSTDGLEDLTIDCASDDGTPFQYAWRLYADLYGTGDFAAVTSWQPVGPNPTINPDDFFIDEFGYAGPYYTPGYPILPNTLPLHIRAAALCLNSDGSIVEGCFASNQGFANSFVGVTYLPAGDAGCGSAMGCTDATACNYNEAAEEDDGSCTYEDELFDCDGNCKVEEDCAGECGGTATEDCAGECGGSAAEDCAGECGGSATAGTACTDAAGVAGTYNDSCACVPDAVPGCIDATACNFNPDATEDDGSCTYPASDNVDCDGNCLVNTDCAGECGGTATEDCEGTCAGAATTGTACTDAAGLAGTYDGSCNCIADPIPGCTDATACNYNADATEDDNSCTYPASDNVDCDGNCLVEVDCAGECGGSAAEDCEGTCAGSATTGATCTDAAGLVGTYDGSCNCIATPVPGCTDATACNYNEAATEDDMSCTYPASDNVDCAGNCLVDVDCAGECGGSATADCAGECNGSATAGTACTDAGGTAGTYDGSCNCVADAVPGCNDATACNYNEEATENDGSCTYPASDNVDCDGNCLVDVDCAGECGGSATEDCASECGGSATPGTACVDVNGNDSVYADNCVCTEADTGPVCEDDAACNTGAAGNCQYLDCAGECGGSTTAGTTCDDGNAETENDVYGADCTCAGTPVMTGGGGEAGTLSISSGGSYGSMNYINDGETVTVSATDFTLVPGQDVHYVYHEDGDVTNATPLSRVLTYGSSFTNNGMGKKDIYVTAYGANTAANGGPDFTDGNITHSNTIPVTLLRAITITIDEACDQLSSQFSYTMSVTGGLPECVSTTSFEISGDYFAGTLAHGQSQTVGPIEDAENYVVTANDSNGGSESISKAVNCSKLPIELISFKGEALEKGNIMKWLTATEINNEYFTLEGSVNGVDFNTLTILNGQGNTTSTSSYSYLDRSAAKGLTYYRLSQTDFDGTTVEVGTISIERGETSFNITDLYPIPTSDIINMDFMAPEQSVVDIEIYDLVGNTLETRTIASLGNNLMQLNVADYPAGVYFISIISDENKAIQKFVVE